MEEKYVYLILESDQKRATKLFHISSSYEESVRFFYNYQIKNHGDFETSNRSYFNIELYKLPIDFDFTLGKINRTEEKLSKSSKYRIKFNDWNELKEEYKKVNRTLQISSLVD